MQTIDPALQPILDWLQNGITLEGAGAIAALGALLRFIVIPAVISLSSRVFGQDFYSINKIQIVNACGVGTAMLFAWLTKADIPVANQILLGVVAANTAIGFHQTTSLAAKASEAQRDMDNLQVGLAQLDAQTVVVEPEFVQPADSSPEGLAVPENVTPD